MNKGFILFENCKPFKPPCEFLAIPIPERKLECLVHRGHFKPERKTAEQYIIMF